MNRQEIINSFALKFFERRSDKENFNDQAKKYFIENAQLQFENIYKKFISKETLTNKLKLNEIDDFQERVRLREEYIQKHPDIEHWDYAEYIGYGENGRIEGPYKYLLINSKGNVEFISGKGYIIYNDAISKSDYTRITFHDNKWNEKKYFIHRLLCSTFHAIPEHLKTENWFLLECNHKNGKKNISTFDNLEWMTRKDNYEHAIENRLIKTGIDKKGNMILLGTVIKDNKYLGRQIVVCGSREIKTLKLNESSIREVLKGNIKAHCGCSWKEITREEYEELKLPFDQELLDIMVNDKSYMELSTIPTLGEVVDGPYKGYQFVMYGGKEQNKRGFSQPHISKVCNGILKTHMGCKWKKIDSKIADNYPRGLSDEIFNTLVPSKHSKNK